MSKFLSILGVVVGMNCGTAFGQDVGSADWIMRGCRAYISNPGIASNQPNGMLAGRCMSLVEGIAYAGPFCNAPHVTNEQLVRIVVQYIDSRPARLNEDFRKLTLEAHEAVWPCKR
jgi:hypothetical protein